MDGRVDMMRCDAMHNRVWAPQLGPKSLFPQVNPRRMMQVAAESSKRPASVDCAFPLRVFTCSLLPAQVRNKFLILSLCLSRECLCQINRARYSISRCSLAHSVMATHLRVKRRPERTALSSMQPTHHLLYILCPANNLFHHMPLRIMLLLFLTATAWFTRFVEHEQERDDMIYPA